jgi:hypothetical protein
MNALAALAPFGYAQGVVSPSPSQLDAPGAYQQLDVERATQNLNPASPSYLSPSPFLQWGPIIARPHLVTRFSYGDRLRSRTGNNANTVIEQISPGSLFELGPKWRLDYTPTLSFYSSKEFKDTLAQNVDFSGGTAFESWTFGLAQSYSSSSQPLIETGRQTDQENFNTAINASHYFNSKWMLEFGLNQNFRSAESFTSSRSWSTMDWLNYQISPRISIAGGVGAGYDNVSRGSDMTYEQFQARINSRIAQKLTLSIHGGGEVRQILDSGGDPLVNPLYGASIIYHPFEVTTLSLSGNRTVSASLLQGQVTESTDISLALDQRLLGAVYLTLSGGFRNTRYITSNNLLLLNREDNTTTFSARLSYAFIKRANAALFYNYTDNSSSAASFNFSSSEVGLELAYRF